VTSDDVAALAAARERVLERIGAAAARAGRDPAEVTLVAVSKTVAVERVRAAIAGGLTVLGENRVQEAADKVPVTSGATWHLIGPLQSNKAGRAVELFDAIQSVDSLALARRLDRLAGERRPGRPLPVLLQVNVAGDPAKAGFTPDAVAAALGEILDLPNLRADGLMTIGPLVASADAARPTFVGLRELAARLRSASPALGPALSMGMTDDFEAAVEEGATIVRVGRALFGERPHDHDHDHGPEAGHRH
jgi:pyridoxal phosphate enzyme (YggS family)